MYDAATDPETGTPYIAMEWVDGTSLRDRLAAGGARGQAIDVRPLGVKHARQVGRGHVRFLL